MPASALRYTERDYAAWFEWLLEKLGIDVPELTDRNHSDAGISILRLVANALDRVGLYLDQAFREQFIATALYKQSLIDQARTVDYLPALASPAATTLQIERIEGVSGAITIPRYTAFSREDGLNYLTTAEVVIDAESDSVEVSAIQGELVELTIEPDDFEVIDQTNRPRFSLGAGVAASTVEVSDGDPPRVWSEIDSFWRSAATDPHYLCLLEADPITAGGASDTVWLVLGDGTKGLAAPDEDLSVRFVRTAGTSGNGGSGTIYLVPDDLEAQVTVTNTAPCTGGAAAEITATMRRLIPEVTHAQRRAVTKRDYEALIEHVPGVLHCQAKDRNDWLEYMTLTGADDSIGWPHEYVILFVVPEGGGPISDYLRSLVLAECTAWGCQGSWAQRYQVLDATEVAVNVSCRIGVATGYESSAVIATVQSAVQELLAPENQEISGALTFTALHQAVQSTAGVSWVEFDAPTANVTAGMGEILTAGTITVTTT